jgi:Zn-dependent protease with chaperone function
VSLQADYYDGRSARRHRVELATAPGEVCFSGEAERRVPLDQVRISEQLGVAPRMLSFADGAHLEVRDHAAFDRWLVETGYRERRVDLLQRSWLATGISIVVIAAFVFAAYRWGLPFVANKVAERMPESALRLMSEQTLKLLDRHLLEASQLPPERQSELRQQFEALADDGADDEVQAVIEFRRSPTLGPNALALPDGRMVLLDELVAIADNDEQILGVLAHELGHVRHRHSVRLLVQSSAVGAVLAWWIGDFSSVIAAAPAALMQARFSRELEADADRYAAGQLKSHALSPVRLAEMLEKLQARQGQHRANSASPQSEPAGAKPAPEKDEGEAKQADDDAQPLMQYLASHPATQERIRALREMK